MIYLNLNEDSCWGEIVGAHEERSQSACQTKVHYSAPDDTPCQVVSLNLNGTLYKRIEGP